MDNSSSDQIEKQLMTITRDFLQQAGTSVYRAVSLDASLTHELGIGSLERGELFARFESVFGLQLPESLMVSANSLRDVAAFIKTAKPEFSVPKMTAHSHGDSVFVDVSSAKTLVEVLKRYAEQEPERVHIIFQDALGKEETLTYGKLYAQSQILASNLLAEGLQPAETVAIMLPTCFEFFYSFFGVLLAGGIPVPIYPPLRADQFEEYVKRETIILHTAQVRMLISFIEAKSLSQLLYNFVPSLKKVFTASEVLDRARDNTLIFPQAEDTAFIQYTSGSTGNPKGVQLTHQNLLANLKTYGEALQIKPTDVVVSWLPLYHDMGLIGAWLGSLYYGMTLVLMSPLTFLARPERWLWAIHYHRGTISAAPNFAYELCLKKIPAAMLEGLDLSCWRLALNGAETVYPKTLRAFVESFGNYGFQSTTMFPVYGLAENTLGVTFPKLGQRVRIDCVDRDILLKEKRAIPVATGKRASQEFVSCGVPLPSVDVRIVDDEGHLLSDRAIGCLQFKGPSAMQGYYRNMEASEKIYFDGWWDSGDLAYQADGEIFITGRSKDMIIKAGRNIYPAEVEQVCAQLEKIRKGCVIAFGIRNPAMGTEKFIIVAETKELDVHVRQQIGRTMNEMVMAQIGIPPDEIVLVKPKTLPKTSSGKLRRSACKELYLAKKLGRRRLPVWMQAIKLYAGTLISGVKKVIGLALKLVYTLYLVSITLVTFLVLLLCIFLFPRKIGQRLTQLWLRLLFLLALCRRKINFTENLPSTAPVVYVVNHASYIDVAALMSVLPTNVAYVGKAALSKAPILPYIIKKFGYLYVSRDDVKKAIDETQVLIETLQQGRSVVIFPEGTFTSAVGLRPFKMGAFKIAAQTQFPISPIALRGTRQILRANSFLLRPGKITLTVCPFLVAKGEQWEDLLALKNEAYQAIVKHCGEPVLEMPIAGYDSSH